MRVTVKVEGLKALDQAFGELRKATARNVARRALMKAAQPIVDMAKSLAPVDTGKLQGSIEARVNLANLAGKAAYARALKQGLGKDAAVVALRDAQRASAGDSSFTVVAVGPAPDVFYAHLPEFGSAHNAPQPFLRPAFEANREASVGRIKSELAAELAKATARARRKALKPKGPR